MPPPFTDAINKIYDTMYLRKENNLRKRGNFHNEYSEISNYTKPK